MPNLDEIGSALIEDLNRRGLLATTLVVIMGEMGRAPRVNAKAGRDHWPQCGFALLFGGGVKEGYVHGASDKLGAYPTDRPVSPGDLVATMYHLLGVDSQMMLPDLTAYDFTHGDADHGSDGMNWTVYFVLAHRYDVVMRPMKARTRSRFALNPSADARIQ